MKEILQYYKATHSSIKLKYFHIIKIDCFIFVATVFAEGDRIFLLGVLLIIPHFLKNKHLHSCKIPMVLWQAFALALDFSVAFIKNSMAMLCMFLFWETHCGHWKLSPSSRAQTKPFTMLLKNIRHIISNSKVYSYGVPARTYDSDIRYTDCI